jgi:hypothetical protein
MIDGMESEPGGNSTDTAPKLVNCYLDPAHDLSHLSLVLAGLIELAADHSIELRMDSGRTGRDGPPLDCVLDFDLQLAGGRRISGAFDVYDRSDVFDMDALRRSSIYLKRSFYRSDIDTLPRELRSKVVPFGPNYACRSTRNWKAIPPRPELETAWEGYQRVLAFEEFERKPGVPVEPAILFQTRVWTPDSTSDNVGALNESRAAIVRALRAAFPGRFYGGLVPAQYAQRWYPDLISHHPNDPMPFAAFSKRHLIGISSRGLHNSVPFKIPEYMAASMAIVSEPIRNQMAAPFVAGRHYLEFRTAEECVARCDRILSSSALAGALREASWDYYNSHVRPPGRLAKLLDKVAALDG